MVNAQGISLVPDRPFRGGLSLNREEQSLRADEVWTWRIGVVPTFCLRKA